MEFRVLGKLEALRDGATVELGAFRQRALLGLLLTAPNEVWSTDQIIDGLWGEGAGTDRHNSLWVHVSGLRKVMEPDRKARADGTVLLTRPPGYLIKADPDMIDSIRFERLVVEGRSLAATDPGASSLVLGEALGLWRGHAFEDFTYEPFAQAEIRRLEELRIEAVEARIEADLARGLSRELVSELETLVRQHPFREELTGQLMLALYRSGRQAEALRAYNLLKTRLGEELGIGPSARLSRLQDQIVIGDKALDVAPRAHRGVGIAPGLAIRGYELREQIGEGALGVAYRAFQPAVGREVAIKVIRPELANDPTFTRRFEDGTQLVARLEHPHIVPLYDYWREPGAAYLVMRLMRGGSLADLLSERALSGAQAVIVAEQIAGALDAAHRAGVVHGDIKPANILIDEEGNAYLSDFGIAITDDGESADASSPTSSLSHPYASPEQLGCGKITAASDIYSLGVVLAQALTGVPSDIDQMRGALPPPARMVIATATAPDTERRYEQVSTFAAELTDALGGHPGGAGESAVTELPNPYKGLRSFDAADAAEFYGRERLVERLVARMGSPGVRGKFVAVVGPSGSGKSSVVKAGVLPALRRDALPRSSQWFIVQMTPAPHPVEALEEALLSVAIDPPNSLLELLVGSRHGLQKVLRSVFPADGSQLVLFIDQFEELFTQVAPGVAQQFLDTLVDAITSEYCRLRVIVTLRADFYDRPLRHRGLGELMHDGTQVVTPMMPEQIEIAVTGPAARLGVTYEPALLADLIRDVIDRPGALPLLQYTLTELFDRRSGTRITDASYRELGGLSGALVKRADGLIAGLGADAVAATRQVFLRLVVIGDGDDHTRRRVLRSELEQLPIDRSDLRAVLDTFGRHRLLSFDRDAVTRGPTVEISHESLLTEWSRLRGWVRDAREDVRNQRRLAESMGEWERADRNDGYLLRGGRLDQLHGWARTTTLRLSIPEAAYLEASIADRDRAIAEERDRERRVGVRLRRLLAGAVCLLAIALATGLFAFTQRQQADRSRRGAEITTLADRSLGLRSSQRDTAALLAVEAERLRPDSESWSALFGTFTRDPGFLGYHTYDGARVEGAVVPNTNTAIITIPSFSPIVDDPALRSVELATGELGPPFESIGANDHGVVVAVSGDGRVAVAYGYQLEDGDYGSPAVVGFDISTGRAIGPRIPIVGRPGPYNLAANADGSQAVLAGGEDGDSLIFDLSTGDLLKTIGPAADLAPSIAGRDTAAAAWAPDGHLYVGSSGPHLREFDPITFDVVRDIDVPMFATGGVLKFSDEGAFVVTRGIVQNEDGSQSGSVARIDLADGTTTWSISPAEYGFGKCDSFAFSVPEDRLWCGDYFGVIRGRSLTTGALDGTTIEHQRGWLSSLDLVNVDGNRYLVTFGRNTPSIGRWQIDGGGPITRDIADGYDYAEYSPDGRWMLIAGPSDQAPGFTIAAWDVQEERLVLELPPNMVDAVWVDETHLGAITDDGRARVIDVQTGAANEVVIDVEPNWQTIARVADRQVAFGYPDGHVDVFDVDSAERLVRLQITNPDWASSIAVGVTKIAASKDGTRIYLTGFGLYQFDAVDGRLLQRLSDTSIGSVAVASDGPIAVGHVDGTISLVDPADLSVQATLPGARGASWSLHYSADGGLLLAKANDDTMSLYDVKTRQRIGDPIEVTGDAALRPDGLEIAVAHDDASGITLWDLDPASWTSAACAVAGRNLTHAEWESYVGDLAPYTLTCPGYAAGP